MKPIRYTEPYTQYSVSRNNFGDTITTQTGSGYCLFRNIKTLNEPTTAEEVTSIGGTFWFDVSDPHSLGDIIGIYGQLYRIDEIIVARNRLQSNQIKFYKCNASLLRQIS